MVQGVGKIDPIANWASITDPKPVVEPSNVLDACDQMLGRIEAMIARAEAEAVPLVGVEAMHPVVWGAAGRLWRDGHFRQAVAAAAEAAMATLKARTGRNDVAETALWQEVFSDRAPAPGKPRLRWPGPMGDRDVKTMNDGLRQFAPGVQMTIRNSAAHGIGTLDEQAALERLATLSLLARWVDHCELAEAPQASPSPES
ncbi:TIGR02391 family protein [Micromonospora sp. DT43]|uniref:TIGR02391 family protein n=1 Tax=Micromonospora sp. DT43 TaxID=3393440 RepID=UPI003CF71E0E